MQRHKRRAETFSFSEAQSKAKSCGAESGLVLLGVVLLLGFGFVLLRFFLILVFLVSTRKFLETVADFKK